MSRFTCTALAVLVSLLTFPLEAGTLRGVIPVAGSTEGAFGSKFRTSLQLSNRTDRQQVGTLVFHPAGASASDSDPSIPYVLEAHETLGFDDVVATMGASGLGSIDLIVESGGVPAIVARAYDDQGELGTSGTGISLVDTADSLEAGDVGTLIVPRDLEEFRFNIGVRTLGDGVTFTAKVFDENGVMQSELGPFQLAADFFIQQPAADFLGTTLMASEAVEISVVEGSAVFYGTATDNTTNDPSIYVASRDEMEPEPAKK